MSGRIFSEVSWRLRQMADFLGLRKHYNTRLYKFILSRAERLQVDLDFWKFMNYGYEPSDPARRPNLDETDEADRVCIQLYQHLVATESMAGKSVIEISSGRGGGASYAMRYLNPARYVGLDLSANNIAFCQRRYDHDGLEFVVGDADDIPFGENEFDIAVNIEASNGYDSVPMFFEQVYRVLKPGGHLFFADVRHNARSTARLRRDLESTPFETAVFDDITERVLAALALDSARKVAIVEELAPPFFVHSFQNFAAIQGSRMFKAFENGKNTYLNCIFAKAPDAT